MQEVTSMIVSQNKMKTMMCWSTRKFDLHSYTIQTTIMFNKMILQHIFIVLNLQIYAILLFIT